AVFRNDCASCHVTPAVGKKGYELYQAACGVCHDAEHRASFVPNLRALNKPTNHNYWLTWVMYGREGSLMPAFAKAKGGPLDEEQIQSLADYLEGEFKADQALTAGPSAGASPSVQVPLAPGGRSGRSAW